MSIEEVEAAVEAEGLTLITDDSSTGFLGEVPMLRPTAKKKFRADIGPHDDKKYLGTFATAEEAALPRVCAGARRCMRGPVKGLSGDGASREAPPMTKEQAARGRRLATLGLARSAQRACKSSSPRGRATSRACGQGGLRGAKAHHRSRKMTPCELTARTFTLRGVYATLKEAAAAGRAAARRWARWRGS